LIDIILHYFKNFKLIVRKEKPHVNNITQCRKEGTWFSNYFFIIIEKIYINLFKFNYCRTQQDFLTLTITIINTNIRAINNTHIYIYWWYKKSNKKKFPSCGRGLSANGFPLQPYIYTSNCRIPTRHTPQSVF